MAKINLLDSQIYNRIAAGEVVENPKCVVKELVENSIDAGATAITIEILGGGIDYIKITDNGEGISKDDISKAVLPHSTSKISNINDLNYISTLGFRGEALPSIASVSELKIISRQKGCELAHYIEYDFGNKLTEGECGAAEGTTVTVKNLFGKIPARKKFLKKVSSEAAEVSNIVLRFIISNYNVSIKFKVDGKIVYHSDGKGLQSAIYSVYGKDLIENMLFIEQVMSDITIYGFVGKPGLSKHNRSFQTLIINGRYVINNDITYLMQNCYQEYLLTRQFPVWILFIEIPKDMVDVNVHPNKMDVKFADFSKLKKILYSTVFDVVSSLAGMQSELFEGLSKKFERPADCVIIEQNKEQIINQNETAKQKFIKETFDKDTDESKLLFFKDKDTIKKSISAFEIDIDKLKNSTKNIENRKLNEGSVFGDFLTNPNKAEDILCETNSSNEDRIQSNSIFNSKELESQNNKMIDNSFQQELPIDNKLDVKILCKIFNTYILIEYKNDAYIIDQHAAHERIIFDTLISQYESGSSMIQPLLLPYIFDLTLDDCQIIDDNTAVLLELGFSISKLSGNSYSLDSVPYNCINLNCQDFIRYFFENIGKNTLKHADIIREKTAKAACKAAVKANDDLSIDEIYFLLRRLLVTEKLFCPHGRPVMIKLSKKEIEKWFKRI